MNGIFITFEGIDGVGKSTQIRRLDEKLRELGYETIITREPGGTSISEKIRELLLDTANAEMDAVTEALLYAAARAQIVREVIEPALAAGKVVLCDRYIHSSIAYQGYGRGLGEEMVLEMNRPAMRGIFPNLTFLFLLPPAEAEKRRSGTADRIESLGLSFQEKVQQGFQQMAHREGVIPVDAAEPVEKIFHEVWKAVSRLLKQGKM